MSQDFTSLATRDEPCLCIVMEIGGNIERARQRKGWTQAQLGDAVRLHQGRISQFERNAGKPTLPQIVAISDATGASLDELLRGTDPPEPTSLSEDEEFLLRAFRALKLDADIAVRAMSVASTLPTQTEGGYLVPIAERHRTDHHIELERLRRQKEREESRARGQSGQESKPKKLEESK